MRRIIAKIFCGLVVCFALLSSAFADGDPKCYDIGAGGTCHLFEDVSVQTEAAEGLIKVAMKADLTAASKNNNNNYYYELKGSLEKISDTQYSYKDSKGAQHIFRFKSFKAGTGKERHGAQEAICKMYGGRFSIENYNGLGYCFMNKELDLEKESQLSRDLKQFGFWAKWKPAGKLVTGYVGSREISTYVDAAYVFERFLTSDIVEYWGIENEDEENIIDPYIFKNLEIENLAVAKEYVKTYTLLRLAMAGYVVNNMLCASSTVRISSGPFSSDDFYPCIVEYYDNGMIYTKNIGYLFDDASETSEKATEISRGVLACKASGGDATDDGLCAGFSQEMCKSLKDNAGVDTRWDEEEGGCIMTTQADDYEKNKRINTAIAIGGAVIMVAAAPWTGGSSLAVMAVVGSTLVLVGTVSRDVFSRVIDARFSAALAAANMCLVNTCGGIGIDNKNKLYVRYKTPECMECATDTSKGLVIAMAEFEGEFSDTDAKTASHVLELLVSTLDGTMAPICLQAVAEGTEKSWLVYGEKVSEGLILLGGVMSLGAGIKASASGGYGENAKSLVELVSGLFKRSKDTANVTINTAKATKTFSMLGKFMNKVSTKIKNMADSVMKIVKNKTVEKLIDLGDTADAAYSNVTRSADLINSWPKMCPSAQSFPCLKTVVSFCSDGMCSM